MSKLAYVVESPVERSDGARTGTARVYVATEQRAQEIANAHPSRTWRTIAFEDMPAHARENIERAARVEV